MQGWNTGRSESITGTLMGILLIIVALAPPALEWGRWSPDDLALTLLAGICAVEWVTFARFHRESPTTRSFFTLMKWPLAFWFVWIAWGGVSAWVNQDVGLELPAMLLRAVVRPVLFVFVLLGGSAWCSRLQEAVFYGTMPKLPKLFAIVGTLEAAIGLVLLYGTLHLGWVNPMDPTVQWYLARGEKPWAFPRLAGTLGANFAAGLFLLTIPFTAMMALEAFRSTGVAAEHTCSGGNKQRFRTVIWTTSLGLQLLALWLTYTRAAVLALALATVVTVILLPLPARTKWAMVTVPLLPALLIPGWWERLGEGTDRLALWYLGWQVFRQNPWFGVGPGNYAEVVANLFLGLGRDTPYGPARSTPHNSFLYAAAETGWLAALAFVLLVGFIVRLAHRWVREADRVPLGPRAAVWLALTAFLLQNLSNNLLYIPPLAALFWFLSGVVIWSAWEGIRHEGTRTRDGENKP